MSTPVQGVCHSLKRFGGRWRPKEQVIDKSGSDCDSLVSEWAEIEIGTVSPSGLKLGLG